MKWTRFPDPAQFLEHALPVFLADEVLFGLPLGIAEGVRAGVKPGGGAPLWGMAKAGDEIVALYLHTPPYPMHWMPLREGLDQALLEHLLERGDLPRAMQATAAQMRAHAEVRTRRCGGRVREGLHSRVHRLDRVVMPDPMPGGVMRLGRLAESEMFCGWAYRFAVDCQLSHEVARGVPERLHYLESEDLFVWERNGQCVSVAALTRESPNGRTLSFVYTPDGQRGRGYASALVASLSQHVLDQGKAFCTLFTDLKNPTSNKIYANLGYRPIEDFLVLEFED